MDPEVVLAPWARLCKKSTKEFLRSIQADIIASTTIIDPPFGKKKSTYMDWLGSAKSLQTIERIMTDNVLPLLANIQQHGDTATATTSSARSTTAAVHNARAFIAKCVNAQASKGHQHEAAVMFCGCDASAAILKARDAFRLTDEAFWIRKALASQVYPSHAPEHFISALGMLPANSRPVVFVSVDEHISNILPWRESVADVVVIGKNLGRKLDLRQLEEELIHYSDRPLRIGSFSAGSELTGVLNDTVVIAEILHKHDAYAFFDFASVGASRTVDMNPRPSNIYTRDNMAYKDGVFLSPHRMIGGPGSAGVLVARLEIFNWAEEHSYNSQNEPIILHPTSDAVDTDVRIHQKNTKSILLSEMTGAATDILAIIRTGIVFRLQQIMNPRVILTQQQHLATEVYHRLLRPHNNITILGTPKLDRLAIFCATISVPQLAMTEKPMHIHHELLSMIMNDFFGVEMGSDCIEAGIYNPQLREFDDAKEKALWDVILGNNHYLQIRRDMSGCGSIGADGQRIKNCRIYSPNMRPGCVRFSFPYFAREKDIDFVLESFEWVAKFGFLLIPLYHLDVASGTWSVRPAVRNTVCRFMHPRRLRGEHRGDYFQMATDCIYGLQKLFRKQQQKETMGESLASSPSSLLPAVDSLKGDGNAFFYSLSQARLSLTNILSSITHLSTTSSLSSSSPSTRVSFASTASLPSTSLPPILPRTQPLACHPEGTASFTNLQNTRFYSVSEDASAPLNQGLLEEHTRLSTSTSSLFIHESSDFESSGTSVASLRTLAPDATKATATSEAGTEPIIENPLHSGNAQIYNGDGDDEYYEALNELSWTKLKHESRTVESLVPARQRRWFVTPLEVVELYVSNCMNFEKPLPCFPPVVHKRVVKHPRRNGIAVCAAAAAAAGRGRSGRP
ncbi:hypothetical protein EDD11_009551 [Mortierella claussenii]|nr:hypothetical protein EDD11_009551 [Mortierella claussenii]